MLQTVTQQNLATTQGRGVPKDSESHPFRPWLKLRLGAKDLDVERQVENWKLEGKATANVTMGIRLVAALEAGNLDAARQICPAIGLLLGAESQRPSRARSPLPESRSLDPEIPKLEGRKGEIARAISDVTGADLKVNGEAIDRLATKLILAGYSAEEVRAWYTSVWQVHDWRGRKGELPRLADVAEGIGRTKALPPPVAAVATPPVPGGHTPPGATLQASGSPPAGRPSVARRTDGTGTASPYLADEYFQRQDDAPAPVEEDPPARPSITSGRAYTWWVALLGQLKLQLGRATFEGRLAQLRLVEVADEGDGVEVFVALVPDQYTKDWLDRHLLMSASRTLSDLYQRPCGIRIELEESG